MINSSASQSNITASITTLMPDLDIEVIAEVTGFPVEKVRGIVWLAEKHMREFSQVTDGAGGEAVEDGFGNVALKCDEPACDLHVVRPGKFQCNAVGPLCPNTPGEQQ